MEEVEVFEWSASCKKAEKRLAKGLGFQLHAFAGFKGHFQEAASHTAQELTSFLALSLECTVQCSRLALRLYLHNELFVVRL